MTRTALLQAASLGLLAAPSLGNRADRVLSSTSEGGGPLEMAKPVATIRKPHQGERERARRLKQIARAGK